MDVRKLVYDILVTVSPHEQDGTTKLEEVPAHFLDTVHSFLEKNWGSQVLFL
jgi:hypothetical protein